MNDSPQIPAGRPGPAIDEPGVTGQGERPAGSALAAADVDAQAGAASVSPAEAEKRRRWPVWAVVVGCGVAILAAFAWFAGAKGDAGGGQPPAPTTTMSKPAVDPNADTELAPPKALAARRGAPGTVMARWGRPADWKAGDWYVWRVTQSGVTSALKRVADPVARITRVSDSDELCVQVAHRRDGAESRFVKKCLP